MGGFSVNRRLQSVVVTDDQTVKKRNLTIVLNKQNAHIQFTKEIEENGKISFLDQTSTTTVTIPYIKGTSEIIARILQP